MARRPAFDAVAGELGVIRADTLDDVVELTELLVAECLDSFEAGFKKDGKRVVSLFYRVRADGTVDDSGAGGVYARADITDMRPGTVSVMPSGLADQLTKEELADLLAFLKATKW